MASLDAQLSQLMQEHGREAILKALSRPAPSKASLMSETKESKQPVQDRSPVSPAHPVVAPASAAAAVAPAAPAPAPAASTPAAPAKGPDLWSGFYKKTLGERHDLLRMVHPAVFPEDEKVGPENRGLLPSDKADLMVENCIGTISLPLGLGLNFVVNGKSFAVPMAVEEPSVIAAASSAAKLVARAGGFAASSTGNVMTAQVQLVDVADPEAAVRTVTRNRMELLEAANRYCASMKARGGGAIDIWARIVEKNIGIAPETADLTPAVQSSGAGGNAGGGGGSPAGVAADDSRGRGSSKEATAEPIDAAPGRMVIVHIEVDVCEAMGANIVNTVAEGLAPTIAKLVGADSCRVGLRILTNLCMNRRAQARFAIPVAQLAWKGMEGLRVAERVVEASTFGHSDPYRASTNNKGKKNRTTVPARHEVR